MIFVSAGTKDGRELAGYLLQQGYEVVASVVSQYGEKLLEQYQGIRINCQPLDVAGFLAYFESHKIELFVDASHPYAANASINAMEACKRAGLPYIRYERQQTPLNYDKAFYVENYQQAAAKAAELGEHIFLTTGSRNLEAFAKAREMAGKHIICRVLPELEIIAMAQKLGFTPGDIVAMQGPFSLELNKELFKKYQAQVVVTKNSGNTGGTDTKFRAAMELSLPLVIIDRPKVDYAQKAESFEQVLNFVKKELG